MEDNPFIPTHTNPNPNPCIITTITNSRRTLVDPGATPSVYLAKYSLPRIAATATNESREDNRTTRFINDFVQGPVRPVLVQVSNGPPLQTITDSPSLYQLHESQYRFDAPTSNVLETTDTTTTPSIDDDIDRRHRPTTSTPSNGAIDGQEQPRARKTTATIARRIS